MTERDLNPGLAVPNRPYVVSSRVPALLLVPSCAQHGELSFPIVSACVLPCPGIRDKSVTRSKRTDPSLPLSLRCQARRSPKRG